MNGSFLLDTNIVIALFAGEAAILQTLQQAREVFIPSITLGELYYGAMKSGRAEANTLRISEFARSNTILTCDSSTALHYGNIKADLKAKGRPIPENDIWIAAIALQNNLTLVTRDAHLKEIEGLSLERW